MSQLAYNAEYAASSAPEQLPDKSKLKVLNLSVQDMAGAAYLSHALNKRTDVQSINLRTSNNYLNYPTMTEARHFLPNLRLWRHDITQCAPQGHYDVAVTRTVLMHIPPEAIKKTVRHVAKCADRFLIFEYFESIQTVPLAAHNWLHDYVSLFEKENCELIENYARVDLPQVLFVFQKRQETAPS